MSEKPENPPAFPGHPSEPGELFDHGMTLRDYFAAKALGGYCADPGLMKTSQLKIVQASYRMADLMLEERNK